MWLLDVTTSIRQDDRKVTVRVLSIKSKNINSKSTLGTYGTAAKEIRLIISERDTYFPNSP